MSILTRSTTSRATRCGCALTASTPRATTRSSCVTSPRTTLFCKPLRVGGLRDDEKSPHEERRRECFDVSFFPEGGYLVNGYSCRVGFKALGDDGRPRFSEGGLLDDKGHFIDSLRTRHAGIGSVEFPPRAGRRYMAEFPDRKGRLHRFELPDAKDYTFVLRVDPTDSTFIVSIRSGRNWLPRGLRLVVHRCGTQCYNKAWDPLVPTLTFRREELPEGLFQVLLLDEASPCGLPTDVPQKATSRSPSPTVRPYRSARRGTSTPRWCCRPNCGA